MRYELAGSEYYKAETRHNYTITYRRPDPNRIPEEDDSGFLDDINYIPWSDSDGASGHMGLILSRSRLTSRNIG